MLASDRQVLEKRYGPSLERLREKFAPPTTAYRPPRMPRLADADGPDGQR